MRVGRHVHWWPHSLVLLYLLHCGILIRTPVSEATTGPSPALPLGIPRCRHTPCRSRRFSSTTTPLPDAVSPQLSHRTSAPHHRDSNQTASPPARRVTKPLPRKQPARLWSVQPSVAHGADDRLGPPPPWAGWCAIHHSTGGCASGMEPWAAIRHLMKPSGRAGRGRGVGKKWQPS